VYSISENTWAQCASAPGSPRGGTSLVALGRVLLRFGGFDGQELGGEIDVYDPSSDAWTTRPFSNGPRKRSVATFLPHPSDPATKAILVFGEKSPSNDGHNAAGIFWNDIWIYNYAGDTWTQATVENTELLSERGLGWGSGDVLKGSDPGTVIIWGGLNERNERFDKGWKILFSQ
jgi:hypothetical protein